MRALRFIPLYSKLVCALVVRHDVRFQMHVQNLCACGAKWSTGGADHVDTHIVYKNILVIK